MFPKVNPPTMNEQFSENDLNVMVFEFNVGQDSTTVFSRFFISKIQQTVDSLSEIQTIYINIDTFLRVCKQNTRFKENTKLFEFFEMQKTCLYNIFSSLDTNPIIKHYLSYEKIDSSKEIFLNNWKNFLPIHKTPDFFGKMRVKKQSIFEALEKENEFFDFADILEEIHRIYFHWNRIKYKLYPEDAILKEIGEI